MHVHVCMLRVLLCNKMYPLTLTSINIYTDDSVINAADSTLKQVEAIFKLMLTIL